MWIVETIELAIILLISIGLHEYAHAYVSYKLGDPTPKLQWRLTPNPLKHLDPIWFLMVFLIGFGRWKPVQINPMYYKHPLRGEFLVAMAGPIMNLVLAIIGIFVILIYAKIASISLNAIAVGTSDVAVNFWMLFSFLNITLAIFNLIPIPPLDGFRIIKMIRWKWAQLVEKYTLYISLIFLVFILWPGSTAIGNFLSNVSTWIFNVLFVIIGQLFY